MMTRNDRRTSARRFASPKFVREGNRAYTSFLTRYMDMLGDQVLDYSVISGEDAIKKANERARNAILAGKTVCFDKVQKGGWGSLDFETSLGAVSVMYEVVELSNNGSKVKATIDDRYDFHAKATVDFPWFEYFDCDWDGGNTIYDKWMSQLAEFGFAKIFNTHIEWEFYISE